MKRTKHIYKVEKRPLTKDERFVYVLATVLTTNQLLLCTTLFWELVKAVSSIGSSEYSLTPFVAHVVVTITALFATRFAWRMIDIDGHSCSAYLIDRTKSILGLPEVVYGGDELISDIVGDTDKENAGA